jgi:hypothetical protein
VNEAFETPKPASRRNFWIGSASLLLIAVAAFFILANPNRANLRSDECAPGFVATTIRPITDSMREFDDLSSILSNQPRDQVADTVEKLQAVRRDLENVVVADCALKLKGTALNFMNEVINTGLLFMRGGTEEVISESIASARAARDLYETERSILLGIITPTPAP